MAVEAVVLSTQHAEDFDSETLRAAVRREIIHAVVANEPRARGFRESINPTGRFVTGHSKSDTGLTGRKSVVVTYGGAATTAAAPFPVRTRPR